MPLHDWTEAKGWEGVHHLWLTELLRWIKPRLPKGYRVYIGSPPTVAIGAPPEKPDVGVPQSEEPQVPEAAEAANVLSVTEEGPCVPEIEIPVPRLDPFAAVLVERQGRLLSAIEVISPRNEDWPVSRAANLARYLGYLLEGIHLLLVDVHRRHLAFSFADQIAQELQIDQPPSPAPLATSYRVGEPAATGGHMLAIWRQPLVAGAPLPIMRLPLTVEVAIAVDPEKTYMQAAADAYLA